MNICANSGDVNEHQDFAELHDTLNGLVASLGQVGRVHRFTGV